MFSNQTIFISIKEGKDEKVYKLEVDAKTQKEINSIFDEAVSELIEKQKVEFTGDYKPLEDEVIQIANFVLPDQFKDALRNPISVDSFKPASKSIQEIRSIFTGCYENNGSEEKFIAVFQRFKREQYISVNKINLFFDQNTFRQNNNIGISIRYNVDCFLDGTNLLFTSYHYARQVFDLSSYYRIASENDIETFLNNEIFDFGDIRDEFSNKSNSWVRRKIAMINDSRVLSKHTPEEIKSIAKKHSDIEITVKNNKIVFPKDKKEQKLLLSFLDEESWKGAFSNNTYISTSKRKIKN